MGITYSAIERMDELGLFGAGGVSILDIGSSNLYSASAEQVKSFLGKYRKTPLAAVDEFAARVAAGSGYDPVRGGRNEAFAGELFEQAGMPYASFDIASGYRTTILDLNHAVLPQGLRGKFDLVLNFGTTEHILNQLNCFRVIHDATRVGGYIHHSLPAVGYVDHGYITYTGRCFFDVAGFNEYEVVACWFDGPSGGASVLDSLRSYSVYFPVLGEAVQRLAETEEGRVLRDLRIPDIGINVVYRKIKERPFVGALEFSTSVGNIPQAVRSTYDGTSTGKVTAGGSTGRGASAVPSRFPVLGPLTQRIAAFLRQYLPIFRAAKRAFRAVTGSRETMPQPAEASLTAEEQRLRDRLLGGRATRDEGLRLYSSMTGRGLAFPIPWEEIVIGLCLEQEPDRPDLKSRLREVLAMQGKPSLAQTE